MRRHGSHRSLRTATELRTLLESVQQCTHILIYSFTHCPFQFRSCLILPLQYHEFTHPHFILDLFIHGQTALLTSCRRLQSLAGVVQCRAHSSRRARNAQQPASRWSRRQPVRRLAPSTGAQPSWSSWYAAISFRIFSNMQDGSCCFKTLMGPNAFARGC